MVQLDTREKVIFALARKDGQLNKELLKNAKTNHDSLARAIKGLKKDDIIIRNDNDNKYYFTTKLENKTLKALGSAFTLATSLDRFGEELEKDDNPFQKASVKIADIFMLQIILRLERFTAPKLTKREKLEFDMYFDIFDATLEWIFKILQKKDSMKTAQLKINILGLMKSNKIKN